MNQLIAGLLDISAVAQDQTTLKAALADLAERRGCSGYAYIKILPSDMYVMSNLHPEWLKLSRSYALERRNPVIRQAQQSSCAFIWSGATQKEILSDEDQSFFDRASQFGICSGLIIPIAISKGAVSVLSFVSSRSAVHRNESIDLFAASSAAGQLHTLIEQFRANPSIDDPLYLYPKEATYLKWVALGKTMDEIAEIEDVKYGSVRVTLDRVRERFDIYNNYQLVALAIRRGLI